MFRKLAVIAVIALALLSARVSLALSDEEILSDDIDDYAITIRFADHFESGVYKLRFYGYMNAGFDFQNDLTEYGDVLSSSEYGDERIIVWKYSGYMPQLFGIECEVMEGEFDVDEKVPFKCKMVGEYIEAYGDTYETILEFWSDGYVFDILFDTAEDNNTLIMDGHTLVLNGKDNDSDKDGIHDDFDSCPGVWDEDKDSDGDGIDDACDDCPFDPHNTCPEYGSGSVDVDDDDDDVDDDDDGAPGLGDWLSGTEGPSSSSNVSEGGGCSLVTGQPAGFAAYIMIALALIPVAIRRRK